MSSLFKQSPEVHAKKVAFNDDSDAMLNKSDSAKASLNLNSPAPSQLKWFKGLDN